MEGSDLLQDLIANNSAEQQVTPKSSACSKRVSLADDSHAPKPSTSSSKKASTSDDRHSSKSSENVKKAKSSDSSSFKQLAEIDSRFPIAARFHRKNGTQFGGNYFLS